MSFLKFSVFSSLAVILSFSATYAAPNYSLKGMNTGTVQAFMKSVTHTTKPILVRSKHTSLAAIQKEVEATQSQTEALRTLTERNRTMDMIRVAPQSVYLQLSF